MRRTNSPRFETVRSSPSATRMPMARQSSIGTYCRSWALRGARPIGTRPPSLPQIQTGCS